MKKLTQIMDVFTLGIGRVIASGYAMQNCIPFLQTAYAAPLAWITANGIQHKYVTAINFELRDRWFDSSISVMDALMNEIDENQDIIRMNDTRSDEEISDALWNDSNPENCDGCAIQELIAAPGETTKCREHQEKSDAEHYASMRKFFTENLKDIEFQSYLPFCSQCGKRDPQYVGFMHYAGGFWRLTFAFCIDCRDELVRRADAAKQSPERFGV